MVRPRSAVRTGGMSGEWRYLILDGYVDEPAALGVPPYISPQVRSLAGGLVNGGAGEGEVGYLTVDQWRGARGSGRSVPGPGLEFIIIVKGCIVPGKYLRGDPISDREVLELVSESADIPVVIWSPGPVSRRLEGIEVVTGDIGAMGFGLSSSGSPTSRTRTHEEWGENLRSGAFIIEKNPDHPSPLIAEIETSRGCTRYITGGCSFCIEPSRGPIEYRTPEDVISEVAGLASHGLENVRIGGQSDLVSYMSEDAHISENPEPNPEALKELMKGVREELYNGKGVRQAMLAGRRPGIDTGILHTDNANPAVISDHPERSRDALRAIAQSCTPGSVLALGLESADPVVRSMNNLNSDPDQAANAVRTINMVGAERGENGMPHLLPGINFLGGLRGQGVDSFSHDLAFLERLLKEGMMIRRINVRAALFRNGSSLRSPVHDDRRLERAFREFKTKVRNGIDPVMAERVVPLYTQLKGVYTETTLGRTTYGRQIGSYPILVRLNHPAPIGTFKDVCITEVSSRSVGGFESPFRLNEVPFSHLEAIPGIGRKRAAAIFRRRPVDRKVLEGMELDPRVLSFLSVSGSGDGSEKDYRT